MLIGAGLLIVLATSRVRLHTLVAIGAARPPVIPAVGTQAFLGGDYFPFVPAKYGMVMLPLMAVLLGLGIPVTYARLCHGHCSDLGPPALSPACWRCRHSQACGCAVRSVDARA